MNSDSYVVATGAKNNAGDFLIKERTIRLLETIRPERNLYRIDRWKPIDDTELEIINDSKALILAGGPALQPKIYPQIYPLVSDLTKIMVPIVLMGVGWKATIGGADGFQDYRFQESSLNFLRIADAHGLGISVRDFSSLLALKRYGIASALLTGCPAFYSADRLGQLSLHSPGRIGSVAFSLGVQFLDIPSMIEQTVQTLEILRNVFPHADIVVPLHHGLKATAIYSPKKDFVRGHQAILKMMDRWKIIPVDISGSFDTLQKVYMDCDFHLGYRLHAHIFMLSAGKPSLLIAEDGRGVAFQHVLGDTIIPGLMPNLPHLPFGLRLPRRYSIRGARIYAWLAALLDHELTNNFPHSSQAMNSINQLWPEMHRFLMRLP
ncbi:PS_pyruv_trans domain-containing protein [Gammaproteobacteria bacterium]